MLTYDTNIARHANQLFDQRVRNLRPDVEGENSIFTQKLETIRNNLQRSEPFSQATFHMAGSFKKNTMLSSHREFDTIIVFPRNLADYSPSINSKDALRGLIGDLMSDYLVNIPDNGYNVKINMNGIDIDLVPTFSIPYDEFLEVPDQERPPFKGYMNLKHIEFVRNTSRGNLYQDTCRLVKYWAHGPSHQHRNKLASSWFLELITADALTKVSNPSYASIFEMTLRRIKNIKKRRRRKNKFFAFNDFYNVDQDLRNSYANEICVLEPTDPADNLGTRGYQRNNMDRLANKAKRTLEIFQDSGFDQMFQNYFSRAPK